MSKAVKYWLTIGITIGALLIIAINHGAGGQVVPAGPNFYVVSSDAHSATISLATQRVTTSGQFAELHSIDRIYKNPFGDSLLVQSPDLTDANSGQREQIAVLTNFRNGADSTPRFARWIHGPIASSSAISAKVLNKDLLLISWQDEMGHASTGLYDAATYDRRKTVENFTVTTTTCLSADGQMVYSVSNDPKHEIRALNLKSLEVKESSYDSLGTPAAYYKAPVASDGCMVAFLERMSKSTSDSSPATLYIHDVEKNTTLTKFNIYGDGRFALVLKRKLLLLDISMLVPNSLPDGKTVGLRRVTTGNLLLYDTTTGKEIARISVPRDGELAGVSSDGNSAYYLSPKLLTVIDLASGRTGGKIDLPFSNGIFVREAN